MMRGHLRILVLKAIKEKYSTGYCITKYLEEETGKRPSYGSIYPLLKQLEKEELINTKKEGKRKLLNLTKKGETEIRKSAEQKKELVRKMEEVMRLFQSITKEKSIHNPKMVEKMLEKGIVPDKSIGLEETKQQVMELMISKPSKEQLKRLKEETETYNKKLKEIKRMK